MNKVAELLAHRASQNSPRTLHEGECQTPKQHRCTLCFSSRIDYTAELLHKQKVIHESWNTLETGIVCDPLVISPSGRHYRTVSKRKAFIVGRQFFLGLIGVNADSAKSFPMDIGECVIEPKSHALVYTIIQEILQRKEQSTLVKEFNYVIVKGDERETIVIFNMNHFSSSNRREVNALSKSLTTKAPTVKGIYVFVDEERSSYYLSGTPRKGVQSNPKPLTKIYGNEKLFHKADGLKFLYSPLSFSQTNHSILDSFIATAKDFLSLSNEDILYDLYCGYGLFSLSMAAHVKKVTGVELSRSSVNDAIDNAKRNKLMNIRFHTADISADNLPRFFHFREIPHLSSNTGNVKILLDPPRNGTSEDVIEFLAEQQPQKVVHIFCNSDIIEKELRRWKQCGYSPVRARPFDMFPGTNEIEMMVLFEKR